MRRARAIVASLPTHIAERELALIGRRLSWPAETLSTEVLTTTRSPGNIVFIEMESANLTEVFTGFGTRGVRAEAVADEAIKDARAYLANNVPVGEYLADQLLIPLALVGGGSFITSVLSRHTTTNIEIIKKFLNVEITTSQQGRSALVEVKAD